MKTKDRIITLIIRLIGKPLIILWCKTLRIRWVREELLHEARERYGSVVFAFWHNCFFFMSFAYRQIQDDHNVVVMVSRSSDGEYIHSLIDSFDYETVRGSTSRGGGEAARRFAKLLQAGYDGCITPDGPRGPLYKVQAGVIMLSQLTGKPILPVTYLTKHCVRLKSWDRFYIPIPFSRGVLLFAEPVVVERDADEERRRQKAMELEGKMLALNSEAEELLYGKESQSN